MMTLIYPVPEKLPDPRARFIQIMNTCDSIAKLGIKVKLVCGIKKGCNLNDALSFYGIYSNSNLEIVKLPILRKEEAGFLRVSWNGIFNFFLLLYFLKIRKTNKNILIFTRHLKVAKFLLRIKKFFNFLLIFEVHEIFHLSKENPSKKEALKRMEYEVYKNADIIICLSETLKDWILKEKLRENKIFVVPHSVKDEFFDIKRENPNYICYTGSLYKWKGVDTLISAMKYLPEERLVIVGGGSRLKDLKELAKKEKVLERVIFTENVPHYEIPKYLSQAKIAVLPNIEEQPSLFSSPLKLFEYMAAGVPIVASNLKVFKEILSENDALFFEPGNPKSLAEAIKKIIGNSEFAKSVSEKLKNKAKNYTYQKRAEKVLEIIKNA